MFPKAALFSLALAAVSSAQQIGTYTTETHPPLTVQTCTTSGGCTSSAQSIVLDGNWRWTHETTGYTNCYTGSAWDTSICTSPTVCAEDCALDGADYESTYGITTSGDSLQLDFVTGSNVGSRVYLMNEANTEYQIFQLLNQEFTFDVDVSNLGCGINGALYFSQMPADGGASEYPNNKAGAAYGTGYCDSQCPQDIKFINGAGNINGWNATDSNSGNGEYGTCCMEMDIWEANKYATAFTAHPCTVTEQTECDSYVSGECGSVTGTARYTGYCDKDGCDYNTWRLGNETFFGPGLTVDTNSVVTVVTQFITDDGTSSGTLSEIRRIYVQDGKVIQNANTNQPNIPTGNSITTDFCTAEKTEFGDTNYFQTVGGLPQLGKALGDGVVLVMSIWDDHQADMLWLDSLDPSTGNASTPGVSRGPCSTTSGVPATVEGDSPNDYVVFSNIRWGDLNSTYTSGSSGSTGSSSTSVAATSTASKTATSTSAAATSTSTSTSTAVAEYGQCGGENWTGSTTCASGLTCVEVNAYYSQCLSE